MQTLTQRNLNELLKIGKTVCPVGDNIMVHIIRDDDMTPGGLALPDSVQKEIVVAAVVAVGSGLYAGDGHIKPPEVSPGDVVHYVRSGQFQQPRKVTYRDVEFEMVSEKDLLFRELPSG